MSCCLAGQGVAACAVRASKTNAYVQEFREPVVVHNRVYVRIFSRKNDDGGGG